MVSQDEAKHRRAETQRRYREANKEKVAERQRRYYEAKKLRWAGEPVITRASERRDCPEYSRCFNEAVMKDLRVVPCASCCGFDR